jgi:hypothetical protein
VTSLSINLIIILIISIVFGLIAGGMNAVNDSINILQTMSYYYFLNINLPYSISKLLSSIVNFSIANYINFISV